jgi:TRAP-type C4-dicarboxylate transport system substrate-binding protein
MSRGTLDGALLSYLSAVSYHIPGLLKSGTIEQDFGTVTITFSISLKKWNALPAEVRTILENEGRALSEQACGPFDKAENTAIDTIRAAGVRMIPPNDADRPNLAEVFGKVRTDWARRLDNRGKPGSAVVAAFLDAAAKAESR